MKVFVAGGTGAIGRPSIDALVAAGHDVTALARSDEKAADLSHRGARPVSAGLFDVASLRAVMDGHEAVVNVASSMPSMAAFMSMRAWRATRRVRTEGSAALVDAALAAGVTTFVQESVAMLYADRGAAWIGEEDAVDHYPTTVGNHAAEASANRFTAAGGAGVVLRFGLFYGPGARHSEQFLAMARRHVVPLLGQQESYLSSIHVEDGGRAVAAALDAPAATYNVVDDVPLTKREYADALAAAAQRLPWVIGPGRAALLLGHRTTSLCRSLRVSNRRFRTATGWTPAYPDARTGWIATAEELLALDDA